MRALHILASKGAGIRDLVTSQLSVAPTLAARAIVLMPGFFSEVGNRSTVIALREAGEDSHGRGYW
jgi:hypothetical protein